MISSFFVLMHIHHVITEYTKKSYKEIMFELNMYTQ